MLSIHANASVINVGDTTLASNWSAGNNILNITGKISGAYTISNAIIQASPFIQIFDTSLIIGSNVNVQEFSSYWYGAKPGNTDNSVYLQKDINACLDKPYYLHIYGGTYNYSQPLMVAYPTGGGYYQQTSIKIYGDASFWDNGSGTTLNYSGDSCALGLQLNKGSIIRNLIIHGGWVSPSGTDSSYFNITFANYTNQAAHGNGVGLWIDPVGNWSQRSGSTGCKFTDLKVDGFNTLIRVSNNISQNGEIMIFDNIQLGNGKVGIQPSQPQEKGNIFSGIYSWGSIHTLFNIAVGQQAGNYYIDGANVAGNCIRLFNINIGGFFPSYINNIYAERIGTIGNFTTSGLPISINNSLFDFITISSVGIMTLLSSNSNMVKFNNCSFRYYGLSDNLLFSGAATFENCSFSGNVTGMPTPIFLSYTNGIAGVQNNQIITLTTDTLKTNSVKISIRKSYQ